jgi:putative sterol carrier protein
MRTPARRVVLDAIFWQMPKHVDRMRAAQLDSSVRWRITGGRRAGVDIYELVLDGGRCRVVRGLRSSEPRLTITVDGTEFLRLVSGNSDPMQAYFSGRLALAGDIMFAAKLVSLFWIPQESAIGRLLGRSTGAPGT